LKNIFISTNLREQPEGLAKVKPDHLAVTAARQTMMEIGGMIRTRAGENRTK
jgi:hypothetical protein